MNQLVRLLDASAPYLLGAFLVAAIAILVIAFLRRERIDQVFASIDRLQQSSTFKGIASIVVIAVLGLGYGLTVAALNAPVSQEMAENAEAFIQFQESRATTPEEAAAIDANAIRDAYAQIARNPDIERLLGVAFGAIAALSLAAIWLGLAITYVGLLFVGIGLALPMALWGPTQGLGRLALGFIPLLFILLTLLQLARLALNFSTPTFSIARNVLSEAVRMKIGLLFIVILLLLLAITPGALTETQPLRFRVQQWMQYGLGLGYVVLVLFTVFFSVSTITFEQRDKTIWQTATKPVRASSYLLGKFLGVMTLNTILLGVIAGGVFIFTQYLRYQPADGEQAYMLTETGIDTTAYPMYMTDDRKLLEESVLVARRAAQPEEPEIDIAAIEQVVNEAARDFAVREGATMSQSYYDRMLKDSIEATRALSRTIPLGTFQQFTFKGIDLGALAPGELLTLRIKVNAGSNDPSAVYKVNFMFSEAETNPETGELQPVRPVPWPIDTNGFKDLALKDAQTITFPPVIYDPNTGEPLARLVGEDGVCLIAIGNFAGNKQEISIPPDGLEILYATGGFEQNFFRVAAIILVKLSLIAAVALAASTFLSFPVACLVALGTLFAAESAGFLLQALDYYRIENLRGEVEYHRYIVRGVSIPVAYMFEAYAELRPIERIADGRLLSWSLFLRSLAIIGTAAAVILSLGIFAFRRRELAIYSGST